MDKATYHDPAALVSTGWLAEHLGDAALRVFDCTTYLEYPEGEKKPYRVLSGRADYERGHIPGAGYLDLQAELSVRDSPYSFTLPEPDVLAAAFGRHGIGDETRVVLYSRGSPQWATRIWWMLRWLGFDRAQILDGGFDTWQGEGRAVETGAVDHPATRLSVALRPQLFASRDEVLAAIGAPSICTLNAMRRPLFTGENALHGRPGRVPGSVNVPAPDLVHPDGFAVCAPREVARAFAGVGATPDKRVITYCGGGIAATLDAFLLYQLGYADVAVYDNSMSEWASDPALPIESDQDTSPRR